MLIDHWGSFLMGINLLRKSSVKQCFRNKTNWRSSNNVLMNALSLCEIIVVDLFPSKSTVISQLKRFSFRRSFICEELIIRNDFSSVSCSHVHPSLLRKIFKTSAKIQSHNNSRVREYDELVYYYIILIVRQTNYWSLRAGPSGRQSASCVEPI